MAGWKYILILLVLIPLVRACPDDALDCITWGNTKSMADHQAISGFSDCHNYKLFYLYSPMPWQALTLSFLDGDEKKDSFTVYVDGVPMGNVDDFDGEAWFRPAVVGLYGNVPPGKHEVGIVASERDCKNEIVIDYVALDATAPEAGKGGGPGGYLGALDTLDGATEIPELGTITALIAIAGALAGFIIIRKK